MLEERRDCGVNPGRHPGMELAAVPCRQEDASTLGNAVNMDYFQDHTQSCHKLLHRRPQIFQD